MSIKFSNELSLWARRLAIYFGLGVAVIITSRIVFFYFGFLHTDVDSARTLLSALITSEAAILAIVVSLSLVAVQLAASSYSARVIDVFRRTPDLWILILVYGVAMFYELWVLKLIERANSQVNSLSNLEGHIAFSYYLGVFAFVALVPYIWKTLELLKPSTVIDMLSRRITKQNILAAIREGEEKSGENDPIQPIIDIVRGSLMRYDYETVRCGLRAIRDYTNNIFKNETFENVDEIKLSEHLFAHLKRVGKLAASKDDEDSTLEVIINLQKIGETAVERNLDEATKKAVLALGSVGKAAAERKFEGLTWIVADSLGKTGKALAKRKFKYIWQVVDSLKEVGIAAAEKELDEATWQVVYSLEIVGIAMAGKEPVGDLKRIKVYLEKFLKIAKEQKLKRTTLQTEESIRKLEKCGT